MPLNQPYYSQHQILTGQYTPGGEFILSTGDDYIGGYHALPNGHFFTEFNPSQKSTELFLKRNDWTHDVKTYNKIKNIITNNYVQPTPYLLRPSLDDYNDGYVYRYFVQKRNNPLVTIIEIDADQHNTINTQNQPGINGIIWNSVLIKWKIAGAYIYDFNEREIIQAEIRNNFIRLRSYLKNLTEFSK